MKEVSKIVQEIAEQSSEEKQSIQEYINYMHELIDELKISIEAAEGDLETQDEEE